MRDGHARTRTVNRAEAQIASSYHAVLQRHPDLARETYDYLVRAHDEHALTMRGGRLLCNVLRPRFLTEGRLDELERVSELLAALFERAGDYLLDSDHHLDLVWASEQEREVWATDPGFPGHSVTSRLDSFMIAGHPHFVEYNAESPASIGYCDVLSEIFLESRVLREWDDAPRLDRFYAREALLQTLRRAFAAWGGTNPSVAIVDWEDVLTRRDFELCLEYFREHGVPTLITDPRRLRYVDGKLMAGDTQVNLIYRRVLLHELLEKAEESRDLLRAYRDGAVCIVNSPRSKMLHKKGLFALLSDRSLGLEMNAEEEKVVLGTIPWTRRLVEGPTIYRGEDVDLVTVLRRHPDRFTLKPVDDYGGRGVVLGWDVDAETWERSLEDALAGGFIAQERVPVPEADFPVILDGELAYTSLLVDTDPLLFHGRVGGVLTRVSGSALLNVTAGTGSTTPTLIAREGGV